MTLLVAMARREHNCVLHWPNQVPWLSPTSKDREMLFDHVPKRREVSIVSDAQMTTTLMRSVLNLRTAQ